MDRRETIRALGEFEGRLQSLDRSISLSEFDLYAGRSSAGPVRWQLARTRLLTSARAVRLRRAVEGTDGTADWMRRVQLLGRTIDDALVEQDPSIVRARAQLQRRVVAFRPLWNGRRVNRVVVEVAQRRSDDPSVRRRGFYTEEPLNRAVEEPLRQLVHARNDRARTLGYRNFPELKLSFEGLTPTQLEEFTERATDAFRDRILQFRDRFLTRQGAREWFPWDRRYAEDRTKRLPDRAFPGGRMARDVVAAIRQWGFPASRLKFRVVRHDLPFGGLTVVPVVPTDVRVLVHPKGGWEYYMILFHEFGHAVHSTSIRQPTHLLRSGDLGFAGYFEGLADLFEQLASDEAWLSTRAGLSREEVREFLSFRDQRLLRAAGAATAARFERAMYARPDSDLSSLRATMARDVFGFGRFRAPSFADGFFVTHPVYIQSYFLALLFRQQVRRQIDQELGAPLWPNRRVGPWLTDRFFRHGCRFDWVPLVRSVTGRPFGPRAFVDSLRRGEG